MSTTTLIPCTPDFETIYVDTMFIRETIQKINDEIEIFSEEDIEETIEIFLIMLEEVSLEEAEEVTLNYLCYVRDVYVFAREAKVFYNMVVEAVERGKREAEKANSEISS